MSRQEVSRLWWSAMEKADTAERGHVPPSKKDLEFIFFASSRLIRVSRKSHGHIPKPPGLEELRQFAAISLKK